MTFYLQIQNSNTTAIFSLYEDMIECLIFFDYVKHDEQKNLISELLPTIDIFKNI